MSEPKASTEIVHSYTLDKIHISERNTRQPTVKEVTEAGLVDSMKKQGQITPGIGRPHPTKSGHIELAAGARRFVAAGAAALKDYKVIIRPMTDNELDLVILIENFQRENPTPKSEAIAVRRLHEEGKMDTKTIAAHLGKKESWVARRLRLLKVIPELMKMWAPEPKKAKAPAKKAAAADDDEDYFDDDDRGETIQHFTVEMMELVGSLPPEMQKKLVKDYSFYRCKTRANLNAHLKHGVLCSLDVPWLNDPDTFVKGCGPGCAHDSNKEGNLGLFDEDMHKGKCGSCLNSECFFARRANHQEKVIKEATANEDLPVITTSYHSLTVKIKGKNVAATRVQEWSTSFVSAEDVAKDEKLAKTVKKVILVDDEGGAEIAYIKPERSSGSGSGGSSTPKKLMSAGQRQKVQVDTLQGKRWVIVLEELKKALKECAWATATKDAKAADPAAKDGTKLYDLVAAFGLPWSHDSSATNVWKHLAAGQFDIQEHSDNMYGSLQTKKCDSRIEGLWRGVKSVMARNFSYRILTELNDRVPHMRRVAALIAFPIDERKKAADLKVLPPKSWGPTDPHTLQKLDAKAQVARAVAGAQQHAKEVKPTKKTKVTAKKKVYAGKRDK